MKTLFLYPSGTFAIVVCLFWLTSLPAGQERVPKTAECSAADSCPNTVGGLDALLTDPWVATKNNGEGKVSSKIAEMEKPD